jgi:serine/threonine-protein kinase
VERGGVPDVVKVVDFGLAKRTGPDADSDTVALTTANVIQGTPLYLSPEAIRADAALDARSDLYAVGAVGYFLLTGAPVFRANTVVEVLSHHLHTRPEAPSRRAPHPVPPALDALILQCLAKEPARRPPDALALQRELIACHCDPPWTTDDAAAWWSAHRARRAGTAPGRAPAMDRGVTVTVDAGSRTRPRS